MPIKQVALLTVLFVHTQRSRVEAVVFAGCCRWSATFTASQATTSCCRQRYCKWLFIVLVEVAVDIVVAAVAATAAAATTTMRLGAATRPAHCEWHIVIMIAKA